MQEFDNSPQPTGEPLFDIGRLFATPGAIDAITQVEMFDALNRHVRGDWGKVCTEDQEANNDSLKEGLRLLSSYEAIDGVKFWIITEADRSATTILLPEEY